MEYRNRLSFEESLEMINEVYNTVFDFDKETGSLLYLPELYDYAFRLAVAKYYTGYALQNNETDYCTAMNIDPYNTNIDGLQLAGIEKAIKEKIESQKLSIYKSNVTVTSKLDDIIPFVIELLSSLSNKVSSIDTSDITKTLKDMNLENLLKTYLNSTVAKDNYKGVINAKNKKIRDLQSALNQYSAKNVKVDL